MTPRQRINLLRELAELQHQVPEVIVKIDAATKTLEEAQARVDEIEAMLAADIATTVPPGDLEP